MSAGYLGKRPGTIGNNPRRGAGRGGRELALTSAGLLASAGLPEPSFVRIMRSGCARHPGNRTSTSMKTPGQPAIG